MRNSMTLLGAVLGGSLVLVAAGGLAAADEPTKLADHELDVVTAGAIGSAFGGGANADGSLFSLSFVNGITGTYGNGFAQWSYGYTAAVGAGASSSPGTSSAGAGTGGSAGGGFSLSRTINLPGLGGLSPFGAGAGSLSFGFAFGGN